MLSQYKVPADKYVCIIEAHILAGVSTASLNYAYIVNSHILNDITNS